MLDLSPETELLAHRLADAQSVSIDAAVKQALEARAQATGLVPGVRQPRDVSPAAVARRRTRLDQVARKIMAMPILDHRSPREIMDDLNAV